MYDALGANRYKHNTHLNCNKRARLSHIGISLEVESKSLRTGFSDRLV